LSHHDNDEMAEARKRAKSSRKQIETGGRFKPGEGQHTVRILETPPDKERDSPALYLEYQTHNNVGPNNRFCRCGNEPGESGKCWLCKKRDQLEKKGKTKSAAKLAPQLKLVVQVAVLDQDLDQMVGPLLWEMSSGKSADAIGYKIRGVISSDRRNYTDHKRGYNLHFTRTGQMLKTKWSDLDHDDEPSKVSSGILKQLKPFVDTGMPTYDEQWQKDCYYGNDKTKGEDDNMAAKKKGKAKAEESDASSDASQVDESSDASSNASDVDESSDTTTKKKKKKKDESDESSDASSNDSDKDESSDASSDSSDKDESSDASSDASSDESSDTSDKDESSDASDGGPKKKKKKKDESDEDESDESSDASSNASDVDESDEEEKPKKRKPRADKGKPRGTKAKTKKTKKTKK